MAFPVLEKLPEQKVSKGKEVVHTISKGITKIGYYSHTFLDSLVLLVIAFLYFFFTGMAILFKRELPKEWLAIGKDLNKGRMARKIKNIPLTDKQETKKKFKIVDLETKKDLPLPTDNFS